MRDSDWSRQNLLRSDWLLLLGASFTTAIKGGDTASLFQMYMNLAGSEQHKALLELY